MRLWNKIRSRLGRSVDGGLAEEMRLHREMLEDRFRAEGLSPDEARRRAACEFGPLTIALEGSRAEWSFAWLESLWTIRVTRCAPCSRQDFFRHRRAHTGGGLALASVAFTFFNAYVLRPFAVADPGSLYEVHWRSKDDRVRMHPWRDYEEIRARRDIFSEVLASRGVFVTGDVRHWSGKLVSGSYFRMLGARMSRGPGASRNATRRLRWATTWWFWAMTRGNRCTSSTPGVLGKKLVLRGHTYEVIGVASREFAGLDESPPDFWVPMSMHAAFRTEEIAVEAIGRLRPGMNKARAEAALATLAARGRPDMRAELEIARNGRRFYAEDDFLLRPSAPGPGTGAGNLLRQCDEHAAGSRAGPAAGDRNPPFGGRRARPPGAPTAH